MTDQARELCSTLRSTLESPVDALETLVSVLKPPLVCFGLCKQSPDDKLAHQQAWLGLSHADKLYIIDTQLPSLQKLLITKIAVDWHDQFQREGLVEELWKPYFCPPSHGDARYKELIAISAYNVLLAVLSRDPPQKGLSSVAAVQAPQHPLVKQLSISTLAELSEAYDIYLTYSSTFGISPTYRSFLGWQSFVNLLLSIPAKVANACPQQEELDLRLEWRFFFCSLTRGFESILVDVSKASKHDIQPVSYLLGKIIRSGFLNPFADQAFFWSILIPILRDRFFDAVDRLSYADSWHRLIASLTTSDLLALSSSYWMSIQASLKTKADSRAIMRYSSLTLSLFGGIHAGIEHIWEIVFQRCLLRRTPWDENVARVFVTWVVCAYDGHSNSKPYRRPHSCLWAN